MKKQILTMVAAAVVACLANSAQAQGTINVNNYDNGVGIYINNAVTPAPLTAYAEVLGGASAGSMTAIIPIGFSLASIQLTDQEGTSGTFFDGSYGVVNGVGGLGTAFLQVVAWVGSATGPAGATYVGSSAVWSQTIGTVIPAPPGNATPSTLDIPGTSIVMIAVPEPTTLALAGLGGLALLAFRRRS